MENKLAKSESYSVVQGIGSVLSGNGVGIADAVRRGNGWIPAGIVAIGGLSTGYGGVLLMLALWIWLSFVCWVFLMIASAPESRRRRFPDALKMCGWCLLPFSMAALLLTLPELVYTQPLIHILVAIWMIVALSAGWSALTGQTRLRTTIGAVLGVGVTFLMHALFWLLIFSVLTFLTAMFY